MVDSYARPDSLVGTDWVADHLGDPSIVVVEVNTDPAADYDQGHVPGAVAWDLHRDLEDQVARDIPGLSQIEELLGRSGIDSDTTVVLYGDGNNRSATWAFWLLKYYRHRDVRLMNGGRTKWLHEGRPLSTDVPSVTPKTYSAGVPDRSVRATKDHVMDRLRDPDVVLLDTRTPEEYTGELAASAGRTSRVYIERDGYPVRSTSSGTKGRARTVPSARQASWRRCSKTRARPPTGRSSPTAGSA